MSSNIDFRDLWNRQAVTEVPDIKVLQEKAGQFKKKTLNTLLRANVTLLATAIFIVYIWYSCRPQMLTTKIGIVMVIIAIVSFLFASNRTIPVLKKVNPGLSAKEHLLQLLDIKAKQQFVQKTMTNLYFILLSAGICLYMIEYTMRMSAGGAIFSYTLTLAWIAFSWLFVRPRTIKKQQAAINSLIEKLEEVNRQLD